MVTNYWIPVPTQTYVGIMQTMMRTTLVDNELAILDGSGPSQPNEPAPALDQSFCVGDWLVLPQLNRIQQRKGQAQRQLEPRLMHLLCYLAANPERVLSRDSLVQELWPRVIVNENSLTRAMSELRKHLALSDNLQPTYIETIPKKGYRLLPAIEAQDRIKPNPATSPVTETSPVTLNSWLPVWQAPARQAVAALCLSLTIGVFMGLESIQPGTDPGFGSGVLADEILELRPSYFGGELTLSTADDSAVMAHRNKSVEKPVVSNDESEYAYIQHDNAGSTVFLGRLDTLEAPVVAVYNSPEKLFNLTWSPLGHSLIFARQPKVTTAALYAEERVTAELIMLDLSTQEIHRLLPDTKPAVSEPNKPQNLT